MEKIKVLQFISSLQDGGAETLVKDYCQYLDKSIFDVRIAVIQNVTNSANYQRIKELNIPVISVFKKRNLISRMLRVFFGEVLVKKRIDRIIKKEKPRILHIHLPILKYFKGLNFFGISLFYTCHTLPHLLFEGKNYKEKAAAISLIRRSNLKMIALHNEMSSMVDGIFGIKNTAIIHNGVSFNAFKNVNLTKKEIRHKNNLDSDCFLIGHIGRFIKAKNQLFLIDVFKETLEKNTNARMMLVGTGPYKEKVIKKVKKMGLENYIVFFEHRKDIPELMKAMDVFVLPSIYEGLPVTLIEAQASGLKCIVSDSISSEAILTDKTIALKLTESPSKWADAILDENLKQHFFGSLEAFNIEKEIMNLQRLYLRSLDEYDNN